MLRSSQTYFVPDDVCVPCRVRHSEAASGDNRDFTVMQEMICTMRVWQKTRGQPPAPLAGANDTNKQDRSSHRRSLSSTVDNYPLRIPASEFRNTGPELVLTPLSNPLLAEQQQAQLCCGSDFSNAFSGKLTSFGSGTSPTAAAEVGMNNRLRLSSSGGIHTSKSNRPPLSTVTIPMKDILLVGVPDTTNSKNGNCQTAITTASAGFYELTMDNVNGQLVLMAFLKANLPKNKLSDLHHLELPRSPSNLTQNTQSTKSFDVEAFTSIRMAERLQSESVAEKVQRRIHRIVTSLEEISSSVAECSGCGCGTKNHAAVSPAPAEKRDLPPRPGVEMAGSEQTSLQGSTDPYNPYSSCGPRFEMKPSSNYKKQDMLKASHLPSGLSVESDPEMETSTVSAVATSNMNSRGL
ncbi:hypothetical protein IV203_016836 [Nitzschia inconspicua]|uniref:Uncharacterized protein n=1 Tax=Nitzschia inconspicua TaxID=303405 RepID=A0A9K3PIM8_9STRA|nr:hypothetical protein IV203_016836 [Nitzschia inconspicua]